jgi:hypothetical protein
MSKDDGNTLTNGTKMSSTNRLLKKAHLSSAGGLRRSRGAATYKLGTPPTHLRWVPRAGYPSVRMGDGALCLDLFEQPAARQVRPQPAKGPVLGTDEGLRTREK